MPRLNCHQHGDVRPSTHRRAKFFDYRSLRSRSLRALIAFGVWCVCGLQPLITSIDEVCVTKEGDSAR